MKRRRRNTPKKYDIVLTVDGKEYEVGISTYDSLNKVLREYLGLTGTKRGCDFGGCGSCTVIVNGKACYSCMYPAIRAKGKDILTVEGLEKDGELDSVQEAFVTKGGFQCGYCTPGFIMSVKALLMANPNPTEDQMKDAVVGNICRCTGYVKIMESIKYAVELNAGGKRGERRRMEPKAVIEQDFGVR